MKLTARIQSQLAVRFIPPSVYIKGLDPNDKHV